MSLVKRNKINLPFSTSFIEDFFNTDRIFTGNWYSPESLPAVNISEDEKFFNIEMAAPGMKKADFNIEIQNGVLSISSEKNEEKKDEKEGYTRKEFSYEAFSRSFSLPDNVKDEEVNAEYKDGILHIMVPKKAVTVQNKKLISVK